MKLSKQCDCKFSYMVWERGVLEKYSYFSLFLISLFETVTEVRDLKNGKKKIFYFSVARFYDLVTGDLLY